MMLKDSYSLYLWMSQSDLHASRSSERSVIRINEIKLDKTPQKDGGPLFGPHVKLPSSVTIL